jgi:repressor LexA
MAILEFIQRYRSLRKVSPTLLEIAESFGVSKVTIHDHVAQLEKKNALRKAPYLARSLEILDPDYQDALPGHDEEASKSARVPVRVLGRIAAGEPLEALEVPETVDLADLLPVGKEHFALRVSGNSMIDEGIHDGDLVIVERRNVADDGEVVVAILDGDQATLKKLYREKNRGRGKERFRLEPANDALEPIYTNRLEIRGVVVGVVRRYPRFD